MPRVNNASFTLGSFPTPPKKKRSRTRKPWQGWRAGTDRAQTPPDIGGKSRPRAVRGKARAGCFVPYPSPAFSVISPFWRFYL